MITEELRKIFENEKIEYAEAVPFSLLKQNPNCKKVIEFEVRSVIMLAVPYFINTEKGNVSLYARARDYHGYFSRLSDRIIPKIKEILGCSAVLYADSSPIFEVHAASLAGLGVIGENGLLITEKYSSFVFLGSIFTDAKIESITDKTEFAINRCEGCGMCKKACPCVEIGGCLSEITQKKDNLTEQEALLIKKNGFVWGCDICQLNCPHTKKMLQSKTVTPIEFFKTDLIYDIDENTLQIPKKDFITRAFSWRGKNVLKRNLDICLNG